VRDRKLELLVQSRLLSIQALAEASIVEYQKFLNRNLTSGVKIRNYMREINAITDEVRKETLLITETIENGRVHG